MIDLTATRRKVDALLADRRRAAERVVEERAALKAAKEHLASARKAQQVLQEVARSVQQSANAQICRVVTRCLKAVFGEDGYDFELHLTCKRGKTEAEPRFLRGGKVVDPMGGSGGGCVDVASLALRLAELILSRPQRRRLLVLDEPLKHLSREYRPAARELVMKLAEELGVQFILVTHSKALRIGKVVKL